MGGNIILIGPIGSGKSTIAALVAQKLERTHIALDAVRFGYYQEIGYDEPTARDIQEREGFAGLYRYWKPFEARAVERVLSDHRNCVIDFGGGHSVYEDPVLFERVRKVLEPYPNVILLLPSPDPDESVRVLRERTGGIVSGDIDFDDHFTRHPSNLALAKIIVYTQGKTPEQTSMEVVSCLTG